MSALALRRSRAFSRHHAEDTDGSLKYYVPPKDVLVAASGIQSAMAYAAATGTGRPRKKLLAKAPSL
jgi:hypothetical protein